MTDGSHRIQACEDGSHHLLVSASSVQYHEVALNILVCKMGSNGSPWERAQTEGKHVLAGGCRGEDMLDVGQDGTGGGEYIGQGRDGRDRGKSDVRKPLAKAPRRLAVVTWAGRKQRGVRWERRMDLVLT
jgi:hypothetical protein